MKNLFSTSKKTIVQVLLSVIVGIVLVLVIPFVRYTKYVQPPTLTEIQPSDAYAYMQENPDSYLFLDVRSKGEYDRLSAENSVSFPIADMYEDVKRNEIPYKGKKIFLICTSGRLAGVANRFLEHYGYTNLVHIDGGIQKWVEQNQPTNSVPIIKQ